MPIFSISFSSSLSPSLSLLFIYFSKVIHIIIPFSLLSSLPPSVSSSLTHLLCPFSFPPLMLFLFPLEFLLPFPYSLTSLPFVPLPSLPGSFSPASPSPLLSPLAHSDSLLNYFPSFLPFLKYFLPLLVSYWGSHIYFQVH